MTTTKYRFPEDDPHAADLRRLALETATVTVLQQCPALLAELPQSVVSPAETTLAKARAMHTALIEIVDRSFFARRADQKNVQAGLVLAAGALAGLVTVEPGSTAEPPSKTTRDYATNKETRQLLAAQWLVDAAPNDRRRFSDHENRCLDALRNKLLDFLAEKKTAKPRVQLGAGLATTAIDSSSGGIETSPLNESPAVESGEINTVTEVSFEDDGRDARPECEETAARRHFNRKWLTGASIIALVMVAGVATWTLADFGSNDPATAPSEGNGIPNIGNLPSMTQQASPPSGETYTEQQGHLGAVTYTDPFNFAGAGQKIQPLQEVQVSCKVLAPSIPSASPDGYWYRIASAPWNNQKYAIANTFLNGDSVVGTSNGPQHNTDYNVPDCPAGS